MQPPLQPETFLFKDDGTIPNSQFPLLLYRQVFTERDTLGAKWLEDKFASHHWTNSWRWGVYPFHHYHSNTHEVLGVFSGSAKLQMGGEKGKEVTVQAGDIMVIPAGVGHKCISHSDHFTVVGAYPDGMRADLKRGDKGDRPQADKNIAAVPFPKTDPLLGNNGGLITIWK
ncbi:cupin domain-containing protein [Adhaeribacter aquaticus]|uniref:cupin domain-containing protein n=1 Tax=Adhaeribacter aquaticus TaxID=299567 RepID=UPI00042A0AB7|nr:cupin domain-containing protein [Adhaeribacter aquaticus]